MTATCTFRNGTQSLTVHRAQQHRKRLLKKKEIKKISDFLTTALLYNLRFNVLLLLYLFTPCFKPCFVGCYWSFSVVATSLLHDGRQKCLLGMKLNICMWKGMNRLISGYLQHTCFSATWNSFVDIRKLFSMFNYIKNPFYTLRSQAGREPLCETPD